MEPYDQHDSEHKLAEALAAAGGPDYKTLFLGACALITLLGGSIYGLWTSSLDREIQDNRLTNQHQWELIKQNADAIKLAAVELDALKAQTLDQEKRIRELERALDRWRR